MTFNKPDGEHLLNITIIESWLQNRSNKNIIPEDHESLQKTSGIFSNNPYASKIVLVNAMVYENKIKHFLKKPATNNRNLYGRDEYL